MTVRGRGDAEGDLFRHLAPLTLSTLLSTMPVSGRVNRFDDVFIYVISDAVLGVEKARKGFERGEVAFLPSNGAICIFLRDSSVAKSMNPIGRITKGLDFLQNTSLGDVITIQQRESSSTTPSST